VRRALWAIILALGFASGGLFIGHGFASGRATDRYVEVKGLAEPGVNEGAQLQKIIRVVSVQYFLK
jgi:hypothetical protein